MRLDFRHTILANKLWRFSFQIFQPLPVATGTAWIIKVHPTVIAVGIDRRHVTTFKDIVDGPGNRWNDDEARTRRATHGIDIVVSKTGTGDHMATGGTGTSLPCTYGQRILRILVELGAVGSDRVVTLIQCVVSIVDQPKLR